MKYIKPKKENKKKKPKKRTIILSIIFILVFAMVGISASYYSYVKSKIYTESNEIKIKTVDKKSEDEVLELIQKYVKYFKKEEYLFEYILSSVLYNSIIHNIIEDNTIEYKDLLQKIKEQIIGFTIPLDKASTIKFHMARINAIQQIDKYIDLKVQDYDDEKILGSLLNILYDIYIEDREVKDFGSKSIKKSILSILGDDENHNIDNIDFILSMSEYIVKLRQYKINKKVYDKNSDPRYLINLNEGDTYNDPIFNQIKIISKNFNNNILNINIKSKSGLYVLKFKKA